MAVQKFSTETSYADNTVLFSTRVATSESFNHLFHDGMALVEASASYLDGEGRLAAKDLPRVLAIAYATESMRLTTRLMHMASWLLYQRAVNQGDMTKAQSLAEKGKLRSASQQLAAAPDVFALLPPVLKDLCQRSIYLAQRVQHFDGMINPATSAPASTESPFASLHNMLSAEFARR